MVSIAVAMIGIGGLLLVGAILILLAAFGSYDRRTRQTVVWLVLSGLFLFCQGWYLVILINR